MPSRMFRSGWLALPDVWEWSRVPSGCLGVVGGPYGYSGVVGRPSRMSGMVERPSRMSMSGRKAFLDVREWSNVREGLSTTPDVREWWETLLDVRQLSGVPPDVRKALPVVRQ